MDTRQRAMIVRAPGTKPAQLVAGGIDGRGYIGSRGAWPAGAPLQAPERKSGPANLKHLSFDLEFKFDEATGEFEGYCSKWDLLDRGGDIVRKGAFKKSLAAWRKRKTLPPVLWQHDPSSPIGIWTDLVEDDVGLYGKGQLCLDLNPGGQPMVPLAFTARALMKAKIVTGLSIGYVTLDYEIDRTTGARSLKELELWEISPVTFPMLPEAQITGAKADFDPKALERLLRDEGGLSISDAKAAISVFRKHALRDAGSSEPGARDGATEMLMTLRKAAADLAS